MYVGFLKFAFLPCIVFLLVHKRRLKGKSHLHVRLLEALQTQENTKKTTPGKVLNFIEAFKEKKKGYLQLHILNPYHLL